MKKVFIASIVLTFFASSILVFQMTSCTKSTAQATRVDTIYRCVNSITGLWEGTYNVPSGPPYYFSFSIYPNGKLSYKSEAYYGTLKYNAFADGTWTLTGNQFSFSVTTINYPTGTQQQQLGTATYNSASGTFTNGSITTSTGSNPASWNMTKVN
jgi:hypothetical protein